MNLTDSKFKQLDNSSLTPDDAALLRCRFASEMIHTGQYEAAREVLGNLWQGVGQIPNTTGLKIETTAEVLLQCGVVSGWLGTVQQVDVQDSSKDLLTRAFDIFQSLGLKTKVSEVQFELGMCYWRSGSLDEARVILSEALTDLQDNELKAKIHIRRTLVEISDNRYHEALDILKEAELTFESANDALKGKWHGQKALVLRRLATAEGRSDYADRAIVEFTAAIVYYEKAHHDRYRATNLNNLAHLLCKLGRYKEAHDHLRTAVRMLRELGDKGLLAQVNETRARVFLAEGRYQEGLPVINQAVETLEAGGEHALLADALTVQATLLARLYYHQKSIKTFVRAITIAETAGASASAGQAALSLIEEHAKTLLRRELYQTYLRADGLLKNTQDKEDADRLRAVARVVMRKVYGSRLNDPDFNLDKVIHNLEVEFIEQALKEERGSVTRAAKKLGIKYQTLASRLKTRHKALADKRTPVKNRRHSIIK
jgi:tetratricopeptide (TPR) repeat protein